MGTIGRLKSTVPGNVSRRPAVTRHRAVPAPSSTEAAYALCEELDQFHAADIRAIEHLARSLMGMVRADDVKWMACVRVLQGAEARKDRLQGWRMRAKYEVLPWPADYQKRIAWWYQRNSRPPAEVQIGLATETLIARCGKFQAHRMRDGWIPYDQFRRSEHYRLHYTALGITDRMWVSYPLNGNAESVFLIDRLKSRRHFSQAEIDQVAFVLRGIRWFHRRLFLSHGLLVANGALSPTARRILHQMLTGMSEKEIAAAMNQCLATTHTYVKSIYQQYAVNSRAELMALWLGAL